MSGKEIIKKFNNIVKDLLDDMTDVIGKNYLTKFKLITRINSGLPIKKFRLNVLKFKSYIVEKNQKYFEDDTIIINELDNSPDIENEKDKEYYLNEYYSFRDIYYGIDSNSRKNLWDILKVLIFLCESYHIEQKQINL